MQQRQTGSLLPRGLDELAEQGSKSHPAERFGPANKKNKQRTLLFPGDEASDLGCNQASTRECAALQGLPCHTDRRAV